MHTVTRHMPTRIMGIVNVTPDSFYDGGKHDSRQDAIDHAELLLRHGADILDIGGESSRPGAERVDTETELDRVIPVIEAIAAKHEIPISIDTTKAAVARKAIQAGASIINDISAGLSDPEILSVASENDVMYVAMHMRGTPRTMQDNTHYSDLFEEIEAYFEERLETFSAAGLSRDKVILDPGIGFGKSPEQNYILLGNVEKFHKFDLPLLVGPSRKSFLSLIGVDNPEDRLPGTIAAVTLCAMKGVEIVRVHDVQQCVQAVAVCNKIKSLTSY